MKTVHTLEEMRDAAKPICMAIGFFDGIHRGHQGVIGQAIREAADSAGEAWVLTFDPHPLAVLRPDDAPSLLSTSSAKMRLLDTLGIDGCLIMRFSTQLSQQTPGEFCDAVVRDIPTLRSVSVGSNFRFGHDRAGGADTLDRLLGDHGIRVHVMAPVQWNGDPVSSTRIRNAIQSGQMEDASSMLGHDYAVVGRVVRGDGRGRRLGFATANIASGVAILPPRGVYAARVDIEGTWRDAVLNLGLRPSVIPQDGDTAPTLEVHIIDFDQDIYDAEIEISFGPHLRDEHQFPSLESLAEQISRDVARARWELAEKRQKTL